MKMENDFCSVPCLLDELMDSKVIKCDVGFGMTVDPVFASKESPSHESDSGCSDMSEVRSVSPLSEVDFMPADADDQVKLFDFESVSCVDEATDDLDKELETYMAAPLFVNNEDTSTCLKMPASLDCDRPSIDLEAQSCNISVDSDSDDQDIVPRRIIQSKALQVNADVQPCASVIKMPNLKSAQTDIHVLPSSSRSKFRNGDSKVMSSPAVKVVKVVKTAAQSKQDIDKELIQALDDRNKKNAIQAKLNREKKKAYIKNLEDEIEELKCENFTLKESNKKVVSEKNELLEEVEYLKSVLANQSALASLLKNIGSVENIKLSSSLNRKRSADLDHDYHNAGKRVKVPAKKTAGICLHVDQGNVSLEFCSKCASISKSDMNHGSS